jgi:DNA-binding MarR family transcriptional regulator
MATMAVHSIEPPRSRSDEALQPFRLTPRVCAVLVDVGRFGILSAEQIARRDGGSRQKIARILQRCVEHGLLRRAGYTEPALTSFFDARPRAYALTAKGARCLAEIGMPLNAPPNRAEVLIQHSIDTAEAMLAFEAAMAVHDGLRLIDHHDLLPHMPASTRNLPKPFHLRVMVQPSDFPHLRRVLKHPTSLGVEPDRLFVLAQPDGSGWSYALELDRGTEDISARRLKGKATYFRKLLTYYAAWAANTHTQQWGAFCKAFRVLSITTSDTRVANMIDAQREISAPAGLFLFSTLERIAEQGALGPAWISAERDGISLLDRT